MSGIHSAQSRLRHLGKQSAKVAQKNKVSVVYFDENWNIDWPDNPNDSGVLAVPKRVSIEQWEQQCRSCAKMPK